MALRKETVEAFRKDLFARREAIAQELRLSTADLISDSTTYQDSIDQASADTDKSFALQMKSRERDTLWQIDGALRRIEDGHFGSCEKCEDAITEARIWAFPFTTLCIECKAEVESEQHRFPGRA
ncbi:TraR/DksA C4-type zinc finger protein [Bdellovibrionota bacterium FG-1]